MPNLPTTTITIDLEVYRALESLRQDFGETHNSLLRTSLGLTKTKETIGLDANEKPEVVPTASPVVRQARTMRRSGSYGFILLGKHYKAKSLKEAYIVSLCELASLDDGFLDSLSKLETSARRIVSKDPVKLYKKSPALAESCAEKLSGDYWVDLNLSQPQVESRLRMALQILGFELGKELILEF